MITINAHIGMRLNDFFRQSFLTYTAKIINTNNKRKTGFKTLFAQQEEVSIALLQRLYSILQNASRQTKYIFI